MEIKITRLDWDSDFFQREIGSITIDYFDNSLIPKIEKAKKDSGFDLIYLFIQKIEQGHVRKLEDAGAKLVDEKVTYHRKVLGLEENLLKFESFQGEVTPKLIELALASGHRSRFAKDSRTAPFFPGLYRIWIESSVKRTAADEVLIFRDKEEISGFVTLKKEGLTGSMRLMAVDHNMRGRGIGKGFVIAANNWFVSHNCGDAIVVTQKDNYEACALYEKMGYVVDNTQFIFHL